MNEITQVNIDKNGKVEIINRKKSQSELAIEQEAFAEFSKVKKNRARTERKKKLEAYDILMNKLSLHKLGLLEEELDENGNDKFMFIRELTSKRLMEIRKWRKTWLDIPTEITGTTKLQEVFPETPWEVSFFL